MIDFRTDDEVAELFARANPVPSGRPAHDRPLTAQPPGDDIVHTTLDLDDRALVPAGEERRERWWLVVGVAAAVALIVSLLVTTIDDREPVPTDEPQPTLPQSPVAETSANVAVVQSFIDAVARHDIGVAEALVAPGEALAISLGSTLPDRSTADLADQFAFLESNGWSWEVERCNDIAVDHVWCRIRHHDRLTDHTGVEVTGTAEFWLADELIRDARVQADLDDYGADAFNPFIAWVTDRYPDDVDRMVTDARGDLAPVLSEESAALFDTHLTEYIGLNSSDPDVRISYQFIAALNSHDVASAQKLLAPNASVSVVNADQPVGNPTLDEQFAWLEAFGWTWSAASCNDDELNESRVLCSTEHRNRLGDDLGQTMPGSATFGIVGDRIETVHFLVNWYRLDYDEFIYWVNATDPVAAQAIWVNGDEGQTVSRDSARLLDEQLTAYLASGASAFNGDIDRTPVDALFEALERRDLDGVDAAVTADVGTIAGWQRDTWVELLAWLDANDERWSIENCNQLDDDELACEIIITDALVEYHDVERPAFGRFAVSDGRLSGVSIISQSDDYAERALAPFLDWLRSTHPDELDEVWTTVDGVFTPQSTLRAAELQAAHLAEYLAGVDR